MISGGLVYMSVRIARPAPDPWSDPYLSLPMMTSDPLHIFPSHALTQSETLVECKEYN